MTRNAAEKRMTSRPVIGSFRSGRFMAVIHRQSNRALGGRFDVEVVPGLSLPCWTARSVPFTDASVLEENRIAPRYASSYSIAVKEVAAEIAGNKENFFNPPRCGC